ncbi:MAG: glycosyltransferase family 9 protein [Candidatus Omnitrophica bacterium]|nr:glycosyltransferase family 9 protein [Candidatus Omnitrophota bacterium]
MAERVLVTKIGNIGDVLMVTPMIRKIKNVIPGVVIDVLTITGSMFVLNGNPYVNEICEYRKFHKIEKWFRRPILARSLAGRPYTRCFMLDTNKEHRSFVVGMAGKSSRKYGFLGHVFDEVLYDGIKKDTGRHLIENNLRLVEKALGCGITEEDHKMDLFVPEEVRSRLSGILGAYDTQPGEYFIIHPGCTEFLPYRGWAHDRYVSVIDHLTSVGRKVVITGRENERDEIDKMVKMCLRREMVGKAVGRPIFEVIAMIGSSCGVLCADTGVAHFARALGVPLTVLFGPSNPLFTGPIGPGVYNMIRKGHDCGPCHDNEGFDEDMRRSCSGKNPVPCMDSISVEEVISSVDGLLTAFTPKKEA